MKRQKGEVVLVVLVMLAGFALLTGMLKLDAEVKAPTQMPAAEAVK